MATNKISRLLLVFGGLCVGGMLTVFALCAGLFYVGLSVFEEQAQVAIENNLVVQKHIGIDVEVEHDVAGTFALEGVDECRFHVKGPLGEGDLFAEFVTVDADSEEMTHGLLKMSSGEAYSLNTGERIDGSNIARALEETRQEYLSGSDQLLER